MDGSRTPDLTECYQLNARAKDAILNAHMGGTVSFIPAPGETDALGRTTGARIKTFEIAGLTNEQAAQLIHRRNWRIIMEPVEECRPLAVLFRRPGWVGHASEQPELLLPRPLVLLVG